METPLPKKPIAAIVMVQLCEAFQINVLFPFMVFMIRDFGIAAREEDVGRLAGLLAASFCFAQFLTSSFWGLLSDRIGRKRVLLIGLFGAFLATAIFGTAKNFGQAMAGRTLAGLLSGNVGVVKSVMAEITDSTNRARAFSFLGLAWGAGCVIGPFVGGVLSRPAIQYPSLPWGPFVFFPYLLPCIVGMIFQGTAFLLVFFLMEESPGTLHHKKSETMQGPTSSHPSLQRSSSSVSIDRPSSAIENDGAVLLPSTETAETDDDSQSSVAEEDDHLITNLERDVTFSKLADEEESPQSLKSVLLKRKPILATLLYMLIAIVNICTDEILPVLMASPSSLGGLGLESSRIGTMLMTAGVSLFLTTLLLTPWLLVRVNLLTILKVQWLLAIPIIMALPYLHLLAPSGPILTLVVTEVLLCLRPLFNSPAFITVFMLMTNSVPKRHLGAIHGVGQSLAALSRAMGPATAGTIWSASLNKGLERWFPLRQATLFVILAALNIFGLIISFFLPSSIQYPMEEQPGPRGTEEADDLQSVTALS